MNGFGAYWPRRKPRRLDLEGPPSLLERLEYRDVRFEPVCENCSKRLRIESRAGGSGAREEDGKRRLRKIPP
jgi:hypothetical protein